MEWSEAFHDFSDLALVGRSANPRPLQGQFLLQQLRTKYAALSEGAIGQEACGVQKETFSDWMNGHATPQPLNLITMAKKIYSAGAYEGTYKAFENDFVGSFHYLERRQKGTLRPNEPIPNLAKEFLTDLGILPPPDPLSESLPHLDLPTAREAPASDDLESKFKFNVKVTKTIGREVEEKAIRAFARPENGFRWLQIAGVAGQGKTRLAHDLALERDRDGWRAGFLSDDEITAFSEAVGTWHPGKPHLIILDYVVGREAEIGRLLRALGRRRDFTQPVCVLLLERQRWDRGDATQKSVDADGNATFSLSADRAPWFVAVQAEAKPQELADFSEPVVELTKLSPDDLTKLVRAYASKELLLSDLAIQERLEKIDRSGRPLFALFLAEALSDPSQSVRTTWSKEDLLDYVVTRNAEKRWRPIFSSEPPRIGAETPSMRLAVLATLARGVRSDTARGLLGDDYDETVEREALVLLDAPMGKSQRGPVLFPPLEPDLLGGWFVLSCVSAGMDISELLDVAWREYPVETGATLRRIGEDFPENPDALALFDREPEHPGAAEPFLIAASAALRAAWRRDCSFTPRQIAVLECASRAGIGDASGLLGLLYYYGNGVPSDKERGVAYFRRGAEQGSEKARDNWALSLTDGLGTKKNTKVALELLEAGVAEGRNSSRRLLSHLLLEGLTGDRDHQRAVALLRVAAEDGDAEAMTSLGNCYQLGKGIEANIENALEWYHRGAAAGDGRAMNSLGVCYELGDRVEAKIETALKWYRKGAAAGNGGAMANLGICYTHGKGVRKNIKIALEWFRKAALYGNTKAMTNLAIFYLKGDGVERDRAVSDDWYRKAAEAGDQSARMPLSVLAIALGLDAPTFNDQDDIPEPTPALADSWADIPPIEAAWQDLPDASYALAQICAAAACEGVSEIFVGSTVTALRQAELICYPGFRLIDIQLTDREQRTLLVTALVSKTGAILLDGTSQRLHFLNSAALNINTERAREEYLRVFCAFIRGEEGPFQIITAADQIPFIDPNDRSKLAEAAEALAPPKPIDLEPARADQWGLSAAILYSNALFTADFAVLPGGMVEMLNDDPIAANLPIFGRRYDGIARSPLQENVFVKEVDEAGEDQSD